MKVGDRVAFQIKRSSRISNGRRSAFLKARGVITHTIGYHWFDVEWNDATIGQVGWHPSSLILANRVHMEELDERG
jgi:hypothetical protein